MRILLAALALVLLTASANAATLTGVTEASPAEVTVVYGDFAKDANGDYIRNEDGSFQRNQQSFILSWDVTLDCPSMTDPGEPWDIFASGAGQMAITNTASGEQDIVFDLEPKELFVNWTRDVVTEPWQAKGSQEILIINELAPEHGQTFDYEWVANPWIAFSCELDDQSSMDFKPHTIILPGVGGGEPFEEDSGPDTRGVPAPAVPLALALIAFVAVKKR